MGNVNVKSEDLQKLIKDVELIKNILLEKTDEIELSDWAKKAIKEARNTPKEKYISHNEVKKKILAK